MGIKNPVERWGKRRSPQGLKALPVKHVAQLDRAKVHSRALCTCSGVASAGRRFDPYHAYKLNHLHMTVHEVISQLQGLMSAGLIDSSAEVTVYDSTSGNFLIIESIDLDDSGAEVELTAKDLGYE